MSPDGWLSLPCMRSFGPLTGIEVLRTRVEGSVVVIECIVSINLTALTIEQVLGKRQKIVRDMIEQLRRGAQRDAEVSEAWKLLRDADSRCQAVDHFLKDTLAPLGEHEATHYNQNGPLRDAIQEAVALAENIVGWPEGLSALAARLGTGTEALLRAPPAEVRMPRTGGSLAFGTLSRIEADGLCCLAWHAATKGTPLSINLEGVKACQLTLAVACLALGPSVTSFSLKGTNLTAHGGNAVALDRLCALLQGGHTPRLVTLDLAGNQLGPADVGKLSTALAGHGSLTECNVRGNKLDIKSAKMLAKIGLEKGMMLFGIKRDQKEADFQGQRLGPADAILVASDLAKCSLAKISLAKNKLGEEGTQSICDALKGNTSLTELDLSGGDTLSLFSTGPNIGGAAGAKHVADLLRANESLTKLS